MDEQKKYKCTEIESEVVQEPVVCYVNSTLSAHRLSDSVLEDIRIGLEQYNRGEYDSVWSFLESIKR